MATLLLLLISISAFNYASGIKYVITSPNTIRIGAEETFTVSISEHPRPVKVNIALQTHPGKKTITSKEVTVHSGNPQITQIQLQAKDIPALANNEEKLYVNLVVSATNNEFPKREVVVPVTKYSGYIFVQTDKPLYLPNQQVLIRILHLNELLLPTNEPFTLEITNPQGARAMLKEMIPDPKGITETNLKFPSSPVFGNWSVMARYGFQLSARSTVRFEVKDYVLPTFSVNIVPPKIILDTDESIKGKIEAFYVYGKPVEGFANLEFKIKTPQGIVTSIAILNNIALRAGVFYFNLRVAKDVKTKVKWFPDIDKSSFIVEATVVEKATGQRESAMDEKSVFTKTPYVISLSRSMNDFKPGVPYEIQVDVRYVNNQPLKERIQVQILKATASKAGGQTRNLQQKQPLLTDLLGRVVFQFDTEATDQQLLITVKTMDEALADGNQASASATIKQYVSPVPGTYVWIATPQEGTFFKVGKTFQAPVTIYPAGQEIMYYMVVSKGRTLLKKAGQTQGGAVIRTIQFPVTAEMVPTFRLIVYIIKNNHIVSDSLQIEVEKTCKYNNGKEFKLSAHSSSGIFDPGHDVNFKIQGEIDSHVGLVAVDEAVYLLNKQDLLTKEKMFKEMDKHDLGTGPGGGADPANVFKNAGILVLSSAAIGGHGRKEAMIQVHQRKKRSLVMEQKVDNYTKEERLCCRLGLLKGPKGMNCSERAARIYEALQDQHNCSVIFYECCIQQAKYDVELENHIRQGGPGGKHPGNVIDPQTLIERVEKDVIQNIRRIFPETWFFNTYHIGGQECKGADRGVCEIKFAAPHSITTWMVQAVGISKTNGMCIADPLRIKVFKPMFVQLGLPKVAVRGEQIEIMATVFNYGDKKLTVTVYMKGVEGICMGAGPGENSELRSIDVEANGAASVTFPIMPLQVSEFPLQVLALSWSSSDAVEKKLRVVHEGVPVEKSISFMLDPTGIYSRRRKRNVFDENESFTEIYDDRAKKQMLQLSIDLPDDHVPGTEQCYVSAIGNGVGQAVNTTLQGLEGKFLNIPSGCGEQTMLGMAPLVYMMTYLKKSGQLTAATETKGYDYMWKGYAQQLKFRQVDGSFAVWMTGYASSTWLTAFVAKVFCQANSFIDIKKDHLCMSVNWMLQRQRDTGIFYDAYRVHHTEMTGGVQGDVTMTAYVLISILECNECDSPNKRIAVERAIKYLEQHVAFKQRPYTMALLAYALSLAGSSKAVEANDKLKKMSIFDEGTFTRYWNWDATEFGGGAKPWVYRVNPSAVAVETTSYALLTQLLYDDLEYSHAIVNWLNKQRSGSGSFVSTQDTVMALQALAEYNSKAKIPPLDILCNVSSSETRIRRSKPIILKQGTSTALEEFEVPAKGKLFFDVTGKGLGTASVNLRYNVEQSPEKSCKFDLTVKSEEYNEPIKIDLVQPEYQGVDKVVPEMVVRMVVAEDEAKNKLGYDVKDNRARPQPRHAKRQAERNGQGESQHVVKLTICTRFLDKRKAGMSILDIGLFTGYKPLKDDLKLLTRTRAATKVGNFEESDRSVIIYFDEVPFDKPHCIELRTIRDVFVGKVQPTAVKIYDYYEPDKACTKFYGPSEESPMLKKICEGKQCFCLEGMCPSKTPFKHVADMDKEIDRRKELLSMACDKHNFVWNGTLENQHNNGSFRYIQYRVTEVVKEGVQKKAELRNQLITFVAREVCQYPRMEIGKVYIIMGMDGSPYKTERGDLKFKYIIDKNTSVYNSRSLKELSKRGQQLQKTFNSIYYRFVERGEGCSH